MEVTMYFHYYEIQFKKQVIKGKPAFVDTVVEKVLSNDPTPDDKDSMIWFNTEQKAIKKKWKQFEKLSSRYLKTENL